MWHLLSVVIAGISLFSFPFIFTNPHPLLPFSPFIPPSFHPPEAINHAAEAWGLLCLRYEIKDIQLPTKVKEAMQMQVEAERKKRANILESEGKPPSPSPYLSLDLLLLLSLFFLSSSYTFCFSFFHHHTHFVSFLTPCSIDTSPPPPPPSLPFPFCSSFALTASLSGVRESAINRAQGLRQSKILASEAVQIEQVNKAKGKNCAAFCLSPTTKLASGTAWE